MEQEMRTSDTGHSMGKGPEVWYGVGGAGGMKAAKARALKPRSRSIPQ